MAEILRGARRGARPRAGASTCIAAPASAAPARWSACHLIEHGLAPTRRSMRLNELWQGNERSRHLARRARRPTSSATTSCAGARVGEFAWPPRECAIRTGRRSMSARRPGRGAHACANDFRARWWVSRWAMRSPRTRSSASPAASRAVGDLLGGGPFDLPRGAWTDDTAMALLLAESLLEREGFDAHDQVQRFARWQREGYGSATGQCVGISASVARALATAQYKRQPFAGSHDPDAARQGSAVAGRAGRSCTSSPTPRPPSRKAAEAARITAQAPMVLDCVRLLGRDAPPGARRAATRPRSCAPRATVGDREHPAEVLAVYDGAYARRDAAGDHAGAATSCRRSKRRSGLFTAARPFARAPCSPPISAATPTWSPRPTANSPARYHGVSAIPGIWRNSLIEARSGHRHRGPASHSRARDPRKLIPQVDRLA